jgi:hypothetical protein
MFVLCHISFRSCFELRIYTWEGFRKLCKKPGQQGTIESLFMGYVASYPGADPHLAITSQARHCSYIGFRNVFENVFGLHTGSSLVNSHFWNFMNIADTFAFESRHYSYLSVSGMRNTLTQKRRLILTCRCLSCRIGCNTNTYLETL